VEPALAHNIRQSESGEFAGCCQAEVDVYAYSEAGWRAEAEEGFDGGRTEGGNGGVLVMLFCYSSYAILYLDRAWPPD